MRDHCIFQTWVRSNFTFYTHLAVVRIAHLELVESLTIEAKPYVDSPPVEALFLSSTLTTTVDNDLFSKTGACTYIRTQKKYFKKNACTYIRTLNNLDNKQTIIFRHKKLCKFVIIFVL